MTGHGAEHAVAFGLDPLWLSTGILILTYAVLLTEKVHSTVVALLSRMMSTARSIASCVYSENLPLLFMIQPANCIHLSIITSLQL